MKKLLTVLIFLMVGVLFSTSVTAISPVTGHSIVIDAGHGGNEGGSLACADYPEKEANLDIAVRLKALLEADGATVHMTRTYDRALSNNDRYTFANSTNGEVLVSIHLNGSSDSTVNGTLGLYGKKAKDQKFTEVMHVDMPTDLNVPDMGLTNFSSGLLLKSNMPATIQETVFISDTDECIALKDGSGTRQQEIAQALYNGLSNWFSQAPTDGDGGGNETNCPPNSKSPKCQQ
jgi:N-acetylmuramoyl-L-alanine amidase